MQLPLEISFHNMDASAAVEARVRELAKKLDQHYGRIMSCRVVVEASHRHHHKGYIYNVRIDMTAPGKEIVINREPELNHAHEDVYVALRDAFSAASRKLASLAEQRSGHQVKVHAGLPHGRIYSLSPDEGFGRIETSDGRDIYFHKNSLINADFDKLKVGDEVRFAEEEGDKGPQASTVKIVKSRYLLQE